jgi:hypothetical protein
MQLLLNRREHPRICVMQPMEFAVTTPFEKAVLKTLGAGGLCFVTATPPDVGKRLLVRFHIPGHDAPVNAVGVAVWTRPVSVQQVEVGVKFIGLREDSIESLKQLCRGGTA